MFKVLKTEGRARRGEFSCAHGGVVQTPVFMNVGTQGAIKGGVSAHDLKEVGCQIELSNTYHLHLRPGDRVLLVYADHGYSGHKGRADGFLERLEERGFSRADCRVEETHDDYDETLSAVTAALAEEPDLKYIYMANRSVPACMEALRGAGRMGQVRVLAHDNSPETRTFLREGLLDFIIDQNLTYQSRKALSLLFDAVVEHRTPERDCFYPESPILTAENC